MFQISRQMTVAWGDCDPAGIVYYPNFFRFYDAATAGLMEAVLGLPDAQARKAHGIVGWPMRETRSEYRKACRFGDGLTIWSRVIRVGGSSFDIEHAILLDGEIAAIGFEARIWATVDLNQTRPLTPVRIPEAVAARLRGEA